MARRNAFAPSMTNNIERFLMVDACEGISGAACRLPELDTVLIARREVEGRRHFDLAHELFHILTWDAMPPEHSEETRETGGHRVEQARQQFRRGGADAGSGAEAARWLEVSGRGGVDRPAECRCGRPCVTSSALRWRLVALGQLKPSVARSLPEAALRNNGREVARSLTPALHSKPFVEVLGLAVEKGLVSMRRVVALLDSTVDDFADLCATHGVESPVEL